MFAEKIDLKIGCPQGRFIYRSWHFTPSIYDISTGLVRLGINLKFVYFERIFLLVNTEDRMDARGNSKN